MLELRGDTLVVFLSDSHIGGDPGCDGFESPGELEEFFEEIGRHEGPVELILAGDFFNFLQIGKVPEGTNRASLTMDRREYVRLFAALKSFHAADEGRRVIYLPGNHDAESFWNPGIQETLRERGLVDEFAYSYAAYMEVGGERRLVYCEHGNQWDPANLVEDYHDRLDTPLGHHVVMDFTRRVAPFGEVSPGLDLSEIKMVFPLTAIPGWIVSRYFYDFATKVVAYLLLPLLAAYTLYRVAAYLVGLGRGSDALFGSFRELPRVHEVFVDIGIFALLALAVFAAFFFVIRHAVRRTMRAISRHQRPHYSPAESSQEKIQGILSGEGRFPMDPSLDPAEIDVFVSGHTHAPSLRVAEHADGRRVVVVNSGCWLRQLQPVSPLLKGPPVFVSRFVLTHVRVYSRGSELHVELWERPKPARQSLTRAERLLLTSGRRPPQPSADSRPRVRASATM
jgi:UDP-2,3-diacylglucosamine pyrophosphatase LpxH